MVSPATGAMVTATSTFTDKREPLDSDALWRARSYETRRDEMSETWSAWCEGAAEGIGETLQMKLAAPTQFDQMKIAAGVWRSAKRYLAIVDGEVVSSIELVFRITSVTKGRMNDTCIAGIDLVRGEVGPALDVDAALSCPDSSAKSYKAASEEGEEEEEEWRLAAVDHETP